MMKYKEDYLSYEDCLKLKSLGYNEASDGLWYMIPVYNGKELDSDEEYELRSEGITEFEYKPTIWWHYHKNEYDKDDEEVCTIVDYYKCAEWFENVMCIKPFFVCCGEGKHKVSIQLKNGHNYHSEKECCNIKECIHEFVKLSLKSIS